MNDCPAFVIGSMRSGTTLLRYLLETHERLACPPESKFILAVEGLWDYPQVRRSLSSLGFTNAEVRARIRAFVEGFLDSYAARVGKPRWIEKTPGYYRILPFIDEIFEHQPRYVFLIRHPLDCIESLEGAFQPHESHEDPDVARMVAQHGKGRYAWAQYWREVYERVYYFASAHPDRSHLLRYEQLVENPEQRMREAIAFLGEDPSLLNLESAFRISHTRGYQDLKILRTREIHQRSVGKWRKWPRPETLALWSLVEPVASRFGYAEPTDAASAVTEETAEPAEPAETAEEAQRAPVGLL